jgi:hypothetical protein
VPSEIVHRAAPCRNVPVTFTLALMKKPLAYFLGSSLFGVVGAVAGSIVSYVVTYWGGHTFMLQGLLEPQVRATASGILLSNISFGIAFAAVPALATGILASGVIHLVGEKLQVISFVIICTIVGTVLSYALVGPNEMMGSPVVSGAVAASISAFLLWRPLRSWFRLAS